MTTEDDVPAESPVEIDLSKVDEKEQPKDQVKVKEPEPQVEVEEQPDEGVAELQRHLQAAQSALEAERKRTAAEQQRRAQAEQQAYASREQGAQAQYDAILNAIGAAQAEGESAEAALEAAIESQDAKAIANAQRRIARAETQLTQLEDGKNAWEMRQEQYKGMTWVRASWAIHHSLYIG